MGLRGLETVAVNFSSPHSLPSPPFLPRAISSASLTNASSINDATELVYTNRRTPRRSQVMRRVRAPMTLTDSRNSFCTGPERVSTTLAMWRTHSTSARSSSSSLLSLMSATAHSTSTPPTSPEGRPGGGGRMSTATTRSYLEQRMHEGLSKAPTSALITWPPTNPLAPVTRHVRFPLFADPIIESLAALSACFLCTGEDLRV
mmetsp:Transcript_12255/g.49198  ORF Transcript_12255/g.49198 Transcript_12255/m.49198 type:complete len:203 (-) Transcript_12255:65-673(-)